MSELRNKRALITVEGGVGKNVMLTSILPDLAEYYEELYVVSPYVDVFKACSVVTEAFPMGQGSLYQELVLDDECDVLWKEPYSNQKFIKKQCHLFDAWAQEYGIELSKPAMDYVPILDQIDKPIPNIDAIVADVKKQLGKFIIVQFCGGQSPVQPMQSYNDTVEPIHRNFHKGQELINALKKAYPGRSVLHYALQNEPSYEGAIKMVMPYLVYHALAKYADKIVCTDSSLQHMTTGVGTDITVIWGETKPEHFGYNCNKNICAKNVVNSQPYFKPLGVSPSIVRMPSVDDIMDVVQGKETGVF